MDEASVSERSKPFEKDDQVAYLINGAWTSGVVENPGDGFINMAIRLDEPFPDGRIVYASWQSELVRKL